MIKNRYALHIIFWTGMYFFWIMVFQKREFAFSRTVTVEFCYLIFIAANFYFNIYLIIPRFLNQKKYLLFSVLFLCGITVSAILRAPLAMLLNRNYFLAGKPQPDFFELVSSSFLNIFIWVLGILSIKLIIDRFHFQQRLDELRKAKSQAELDFLNAQFNPHFLFNSINTIYGHIDKHNSHARKMLLTFSEMLRYQLYECNSPNIAVEKEMQYLKNYVALQEDRKAESLVVNIQVDEKVKGFSISPLLFIAFIENAFKYASNFEDRENRIDVSLGVENNELVFMCRNTFEISDNNVLEQKGIGIDNVKRRLALLYPEKHNLEIKQEDSIHHVSLKISLS